MLPKIGAIGLGSTISFGWADHPAADGTGHLSTKIDCNVENLSTLCGAPKLRMMVEIGILIFRIFFRGPKFLSSDHRRLIFFSVDSWHRRIKLALKNILI
jgi:hypothetical protein